jgi:catechol 2,3-dioxygenase-like lactoylglutathione lyase family enzyme
MLDAHAPIAFLATANPDRARFFYADIQGVPLRIQKVREFTPQPFTALGWQVANAAHAVATLHARGVTFERYPFLLQDEQEIWDAPGGARIAWFKDPEGNLLSLTEIGAA